MSFAEYIQLVFTDYTLRTITLGTAVLGAASGALGSFAVLRKQSLLGDAISHAALPGIVLAFMWTGTKDSYVLLLGALICGLIGTFWIHGITKKTHLKTDTALGLVLSLFFGFGMLLLTYIQKNPDASQAGLDKYLFGQAATLVSSDVYIMLSATTVSFLVLLLFWKEFKVMLFDESYAKTLGFNIRLLDRLITFFIVLVIVLGLQTVGVVLMSALLLAPAAAARQWTNSLSSMVILAGFIGAFTGVVGTGISAQQENLSTGPVIVLVASVFVLFSFLFSPFRGLVVGYIKRQRKKRDLDLEKALQSLYNVYQGEMKEHSISFSATVLSQLHLSPHIMRKMERKEWVVLSGHEWQITLKGMKKVKKMYGGHTYDE